MRGGYKVAAFLREFDWAAKDFYATNGRPFEGFPHGASGYFHERLIALVRSRGDAPLRWVADDTHFVELLYALLAAWGMDSRTARLSDFPDFARAVRHLVASPAFRVFEREHLRSFNDGHVKQLAPLWQTLMSEAKIMASESILVGSSKLLHHLLPDLFPPIDRTYTLAFLGALDQSERFRLSTFQCQRPGLDVFCTVMRFFAHVARSVPGIENYLGKGPMSGSIPKVIDNAVITWWGTE